MPLKIYFEDEFREITDTAVFFDKYELITAAGGVVRNEEGKILMIFRRNKWDLPKGKMEENESFEKCAEREIMEETGLNKLVLNKPLTTTYHTYTEKGKEILKDTHWFLFDAPGEQPLLPQTEEDITGIEWAGEEELQKYARQSYQLIRDVLQAAGLPV